VIAKFRILFDLIMFFTLGFYLIAIFCCCRNFLNRFRFSLLIPKIGVCNVKILNF
jgi:hypothetical protein